MSEEPEPTGSAPSDVGGLHIDEVIASGRSEGNCPTDRGRRPSALDADLANELAARRRPTVLVLAGGVGCGKTSAYAALYERLGRGPFAGRLFAGSVTIPGFEERCHHWRQSSNMPNFDMRRTHREDLPWLHIRLRDAELEGEPQDLLLGDFDGERFDHLLANEQQSSDLPFLRRADHVGVVIDGERIADQASRADESVRLTYLVDQLYSDPEASPVSVILVITKVDLIDSIPTEARGEIEAAISSIHDHLQTRAMGSVPIVRLAVRSKSSRFPLGHGLEDLLELLSLRPATHVETKPPLVIPQGSLAEFRA